MNSPRIFYLEDDPLNARLGELFLNSQLGAVVVYGAHDNLVFQERAEPFDVAIVSIALTSEIMGVIHYPNVSMLETGLEFIHQVRSGAYEKYGFPADIPIIALTDHFDNYKSLEDGGQVAAVLQKPADPATLIEKIRDLLEE